MTFFSFYFHNLSYIAECIIVIIAFCRFFERRSYYPVRAAVSIVLLLLSGYLCTQIIPLGSDGALWKHVIYYALLMIALLCCHKINIQIAAFCVTNAFCIQNMLYELYCLLLLYTNISDYTAGGFILRTAICAAAFVILFLLCNHYRVQIRGIRIKSRIDMLFLFIGFINVAVATYGKFKVLRYTSGNLEFKIIFHWFILLFCLTILILQLCIVRSKRSEQEKNTIAQLLHMQEKSYAQQKNIVDNINIKCHDLKHQLIRFRENIDEREMDETLQLIDMYDGMFQTGNQALDLVLLEKGFDCRENNIRLSCLVDGGRLSFLTDAEIYSLFGNAIDNAIQAAKEVQEDNRFISITECRQNNLVDICIENCYSGDLCMLDGMPQTKGDPLDHGFGLKSIKTIAEKYNGRMSINTESNVFTLNIFLASDFTAAV